MLYCQNRARSSTRKSGELLLFQSHHTSLLPLDLSSLALAPTSMFTVMICFVGDGPKRQYLLPPGASHYEPQQQSSADSYGSSPPSQSTPSAAATSYSPYSPQNRFNVFVSNSYGSSSSAQSLGPLREVNSSKQL